MAGPVRTMTIALSTLLMAWSPGVAFADPCDPLDVDCLAGTLEPDEALDDPIGSVTDTLDGAGDSVDPVLDPVLDVVDDLLGGGGIVDPPGGHVPGDHTAGPGSRVGGTGEAGPAGSASGPSAIARESGRPPTLIGTASSGSRPAAPSPPPDRFDGLVEGAVRGLLLVAILFGLTVAFAAVQGRLDRNDPKLAGAPLRPEVVTFG
ncbi:MAG TPA: hypothetical protein VFQ40_06720 [Actinomycetota bacterium]|nr:hypothetical protein [Actinomycetota bacterium]